MLEELQILGYSAGIPTPKQGTSSTMISCRDFDIMIDCGEGTYLQWYINQYHWDRLKYIVITHLHPDHICGLIPLLFYKHIQKSSIPITIICSEEVKDFVNSNLLFHNMEPCYDMTFCTTHSIKIENELEISSFPMKHSIPCLAFRFDGQTHSIAFITDTIPNDNSITISKDVNILIHESTYPMGEGDNAIQHHHSSTDQALTIAKAANAKRLLLTHIGPTININTIKNIFFNGNLCFIANKKISIH